MTLLSLVPIAIYLVVLRSFDAFSMVRMRTLAAWMIWGMASAMLMWATVAMARSTGHTWTAPWVSPIIEETLKVLPLLCFVWSKRVVFSAETQLFGQAIGGGFALVENIIYLQHFPSMDAPTALVRGLGTGLLHMGCTALAATILLLALQSLTRWKHRTEHLQNSQSGSKPSRADHPSGSRLLLCLTTCTLLLAIAPSVLIHIAHNVLTISPMMLMVGLMVIFFVLFYAISILGERSVIRWLDVSMNDDISLIAALREGRLEETKAGDYLKQLRSRFEPLIFFDMCVYVQLYLELLIEAKARVMLHDAGLEQEETPESKTDRQARLTELHAIEQRIPRLGKQLLRPLIHSTDQDEWVLRRS